MMRTIKPREDGCYVYFHPTTIKVLQAIEDNLERNYDMTWRGIAEIAGISVSTLYRHLEALESVEYICRRYGGRFSDTIQQMSLNDELEYACEERAYVD